MRTRILIARILIAVVMMTTVACAAAPVHDVTITARDYAFTIPASVPAGLTAFHFVNRGKVPHEVQFFRFNPGVSATTARAYLATGSVPDSVADPSGSVLIATPGDSVREALLVQLRPGERYALLCQFHDSAGKPQHTQLGMVGLIEVR
jgi:uncharacterized cupredoxin-like copper-binding protein